MEYPKCKLCERGDMVPVDTEEASGWVCTNPSCGFYILLVGKRLKVGRIRIEQEDEDTDKEG